MSSSKAITAMNPEVFHFTSQPHLHKPSFLVGWTKDTGAVSPGAMDFLTDLSGADSFCRIEPANFFAVGGVTVEDNIARFPQSTFFSNERSNLVILQSDEPQSHKYEFLNAVLDLAEHYGGAETLYTVNGVASMISHTMDRRAFLVSNDVAVQKRLRRFVSAPMTWQGPPHTSTYLLWLAARRHLPGAGLWFEVPFYLAGQEDFRSIKAAVSLLGRILGWEYDLSEFDRHITAQDEALTQLRQEYPEIDAKLQILEQGERLDTEEQQELMAAVENALKQRTG